MSLQAVGRAADSAIRAFKTVAPAIVVVAALATAVAFWRVHQPVQAPIDPLTTLGRSYVVQLGDVYAGAWNEGAKALDAGKPVADALAVVAGSWQAGRVALFNASAAPVFSKIVAENKADKEVSPQDKAALAAAWRGFAVGLASPADGK